MLCEVPLTKEQQEFAAEHHGLVYKFLNDNHLPDDEFYDVVIFGYLKAVRDYFSREVLRQYSFATIAWRAMSRNLSNHFKTQARKSATLKSSAFTSACTRTACPWRNCCRRRMI